MSTEAFFSTLQEVKLSGRPKGSHNSVPAQKNVGTVPIPTVADEPETLAIRPLLVNGLLNLPEAKFIGRPKGSKNSAPRKRRARPQESEIQVSAEQTVPPPLVR